MPLVTSAEMFKKAYSGGYAVGAFNVNNMEIVQAIVEAADELKSPVILQASAGARKYAKNAYLKHLVEAAVETTDIPIVLHLDHGADFETCKDCVDGGFTSVMIARRTLPSPRKLLSMLMSAALLLRLSLVPSAVLRMMSP